MYLLIALSAIIVPFFLLVLLRMSAAKGMTISAVIVILLAITVWGMEGIIISSSILQGIHKALTILWILFGALLLLNTLQRTGAVVRINQGFRSISEDMRVQAIIVAFLFGALIEGAAGFGAPAMVTGPLLFALGFSPLVAATLALIADSTSVAFGAVGTPLTVGLSNSPEAGQSFFHEVAVAITSMDLMAGTFIPFMVVAVLTTFFGKGFKESLPMLPWTLFIGITYTVSAFIYAYLFGHEFVSILASLTGLIIATWTAKKGWLMPKDTWKEALREDFETQPNEESMSILSAWAPYVAVVVLLLLTRTVGWLEHFTQSFIDLTWTDILGVAEIDSDWELLYSPGTILAIAALVAVLVQRKSFANVTKATTESLTSMKMTAIALISTLIMVQVFVNSGMNLNDLTSMPNYIAQAMASSMGPIWIFVAPFLGELGSFISGSATVSTLTFSPIQIDVANSTGYPVNTVLAAQLIGAGAGNMFCVHNVVAASGAVGLSGKEGDIIRKTLLPAIIYGLLIGIAGFIVLFFFVS